jgi:D-alanyl-D-alanine carboxypeptidase
MGRHKLTDLFATLRGRRGIAVGFLGAFAVATTTADPVFARHAKHHSDEEHSKSAAHSHSGGPPYADIVVDASSGAILHSVNPDELRHPASLTKIMTLYLLFERLEAGKVKLDTPLDVSEHAAAQSPTKLELKPGQTIAVEDAIRGLVTKSANDAAVVVAEAIGGSERDFAEMMTRKAQALGMERTVYRNASGLPDAEQVTTARDQALLGRAIQERFPRYYRYFATPSFTYHGETMRNHNRLLGHVEGLDGIKTGYTEASGYNLVTSVHRNNRHIVSVVLGGSSGGARDARMRSLIEQYIMTAAVQKGESALADALTAPEVQVAEPRATERSAAPPRDTRPSKPAATYSVASVSSRIVQTSGGPAADPQASRARHVPALDPAPTAAVSTPAASAGDSASDPIKPILVKTVKVRLPPSEATALATPHGVLAPPPPPPPSPPHAASPQIVAALVPWPQAADARVAQGALGEPTAPQERSIPAPPKPARAEKPSMPVIAVAPASAVAEPHRDLAPDALPAAAPLPAPSASNAPPRNARPQSAALHSGWIIQVGAFEAEGEARQKLSAVQAKAAPLTRAEPFTEPVVKGDKTLYRARFAGLQKNEAEAVCRQLKRNDIDCMTIKN